MPDQLSTGRGRRLSSPERVRLTGYLECRTNRSLALSAGIQGELGDMSVQRTLEGGEAPVAAEFIDKGGHVCGPGAGESACAVNIIVGV
jgi:hypothetical protein